MSANTEDMVSDPCAPTLQESRTAIDNYPDRKRSEEKLGNDVTVMRGDFLPVSDHMTRSVHTLAL